MAGNHVRERVIFNDLKDPVFISAFISFDKGGSTASSALSYALEQWGAVPVMEFEAEDCYNNTRIRPMVQKLEDRTVVSWPQNMVYRIDGEERSFLFLLGVEPSIHWRDYIEGVADFVMRAGVRTAINLKAVSGAVPHTQPVPLRAIYSDDSLQEQMGIAVLENQDGPADVGRLLNLQLASLGCHTVDIYAFEPFYVPALPYVDAGISLLNALQSAFALELSLEQLVTVADGQKRAIEAAVSQSEQLVRTIEMLEQRQQQVSLLEQGSASGGDDGQPIELNAGDVLQEAEEILRSIS